MTDTSREAIEALAERFEEWADEALAHDDHIAMIGAAITLRALVAERDAALRNLEMAKSIQKIAWREALEEAADMVAQESCDHDTATRLPRMIRAIPFERDEALDALADERASGPFVRVTLTDL